MKHSPSLLLTRHKYSKGQTFIHVHTAYSSLQLNWEAAPASNMEKDKYLYITITLRK